MAGQLACVTVGVGKLGTIEDETERGKDYFEM